MGNHDARAGFAAELGDGHGGRSTRVGDAPRGVIHGVSEVGGYRFVTLDSSVPGAGYGHLDDEQLRWLRRVLATGSERGTVVVLHHPPVPAITPLLRALQLQNPEDLAAAIDGTDVRLILAGHYHHLLVDRLGRVPVVVAPGVANTTDVLAPPGTERAHVGSAALLLELSGTDGLRLSPVTARNAEAGRVVFALTEAEVDRIAALAGPPCTSSPSRATPRPGAVPRRR